MKIWCSARRGKKKSDIYENFSTYLWMTRYFFLLKTFYSKIFFSSVIMPNFFHGIQVISLSLQKKKIIYLFKNRRYQGWKFTRTDTEPSHTLEEPLPDWSCLQGYSCTHCIWPIADWWSYLTHSWRFWIQSCPSPQPVTTQDYKT